MFGMKKKIKELEDKLDKIYSSDVYNYYASMYKLKYAEALKIAKKEVLTYKPLVEFGFDFKLCISWEKTSRNSDIVKHNKWVCDGIWFNEEDCKILDTLYDNAIKENLMKYPNEQKSKK